MLAATLLLVSQCADPGFCPTEVELLRAVQKHRETAEMAFFLSLTEEERGGTTLTPWPVVTQVSDIACDQVRSDPQPTVLCRVLLRYPKRAERTAFRLRRADGMWSVVAEIGG